MDIDEILNKLSISDLCGQLLCLDVSDKDDPKEVEQLFKKVKPGGIFVANMSKEKILFYKDLANKYTKLPCIVAADVEYGAGSAIKNEVVLPHPMAWGAANDSELVEVAGYLSAKICKQCGIDYTFSPMVDINYNFLNPVINIRSISDSPDLVIKQGGAYLKGLKRGGLTCAVKTFPGDGIDDRNQHFCTTTNTLDKEKWNETYGKVFKEMFKLGAESVMIGHISLPSYDDYCDEVGYMPAVLSKKLMVDLLRTELGFNGCIVSDAMSMVGACSRFDIEKLSVEFIKNGGDFVLFPESNDNENLLNAVNSGYLTKERIVEAFKHIYLLKKQSGLFDDMEIDNKDYRSELEDISNKIAEKSVKIIRDYNQVLYQGIKKGSKILNIYLFGESRRESDRTNIFNTLEEELINRGCQIEIKVNPKHKDLEKILDNFDAVIVSAKFVTSDFCAGSSLRIGWENIMTFWRGYVLRHKKLIFISFGDPYKLYELPFLKTYINAFSPSKSSQKAIVKLLFKEIECTAINPVGLDGYFKEGE